MEQVNTAVNLPEFIALIKRYENITIEEIENTIQKFALEHSIETIEKIFKEFNFHREFLTEMTGFGTSFTCTLCLSARANNANNEEHFCLICVYRSTIFGRCTGCQQPAKYDVPSKTYNKILFANTPKRLLKAYKARAKYMRTILKKINVTIE